MSEKTRLLVLGRVADEAAERIRVEAPELAVTVRGFDDATPADLDAAEVLLAFRIPRAIEHAAGNVRWVQSSGAGVDGLLGCPTLREDVPITRVVGAFNLRMSEYVLARCLAIAQRIPQLETERRARRWAPFYPRTLRELRVTIVGVGEIGGAAARALTLHGARVVGVNRTGAAVDGVPEVVPLTRLPELLPRTDVLVLVVPRTRATERLIGRRELDLLPRDAWIVNVARGAVIDEAALSDSLAAGRIGGAALDVFETEPLPESSPLWSSPNVMFSPHVAGLTTPDEAADAFLGNWRRFRVGEPLVGVIDRARGY